jgi:hypothetical protein
MWLWAKGFMVKEAKYFLMKKSAACETRSKVLPPEEIGCRRKATKLQTIRKQKLGTGLLNQVTFFDNY